MRIVLDGNTAFEYWMSSTLSDEAQPVHAAQPQLSSFNELPSSELSRGIGNQEGASGGIEVLVDSLGERRNSDLVTCGVWSAKTPLPPNSIYMIGSGIYVESPELCLLRLASIMERTVFLRALSDMLGIYGLSVLDRLELVSREPITSISKIKKFMDRVKGAYGVKNCATL